MKTKTFSSLFAGCLLSAAACAWAGKSVTGAAGEWAVVVEEQTCPVVRFAAAELTNGLSRTLGAPVPVVTAPQPGKANVVLGENRWSRAEGLDPKPLVRADEGTLSGAMTFAFPDCRGGAFEAYASPSGDSWLMRFAKNGALLILR